MVWWLLFQIPTSRYFFQHLPAPSNVENTVFRPYFFHIFPNISKYRIENLHFSSTSKYSATPSPFKVSCNQHDLNFDNVIEIGNYTGLLKIKIFQVKGYDVIIFSMTSKAKLYHVTQFIMQIGSCDQSLVTFFKRNYHSFNFIWI